MAGPIRLKRCDGSRIGWIAFSPFGAGPAETSARRRGLAGLWTPQIESFQRNDQFVIRTDLPGLTSENVRIELEDDAIVITGERSSDEQHEDDGFSTSERSYGRFCRVVPVPEGAIADTITARFENGVLEISMQAPPQEAPARPADRDFDRTRERHLRAIPPMTFGGG